MENNTKNTVPAKYPRAYQNDSEDAKSRFSTLNNMENVMQENSCPSHFPTSTFFMMEALRDFWRACQGRMKQEVFSRTYWQLTCSIVLLSVFGLLTILSKIVLQMCRFFGRNFALQVLYAKLILKASIFHSSDFDGFCMLLQFKIRVRTHSELPFETCPCYCP